ncbi:hypothetical protein D3C73_1035070 [compost metagenome]
MLFNVNSTPEAVAVLPTIVPLETGRLSAVIGAAYKSKVVSLVNFSTAEPFGKLALYAAGSVIRVLVACTGPGLPGARDTLKVSGLDSSENVRPVSAALGSLTFRFRSMPRKLKL